MISGCPGDICQNTESGVAMAQVNWTSLSVTDNWGPPTLMCDYNPGDSFSIGNTTVMCIADDPAGNRATCAFNVTIIGMLC